MAFSNYIHVLAAAFLMGLVAAAPIGPVNMMAIRRGVIGGWRHTLACGIGSVFGDLALFSLALAGGKEFLPRLANPKVHTAVRGGWRSHSGSGRNILPCALREPSAPGIYRRARRLWGEGPLPSLLLGEAAKSTALTMFNPLSMVYWIAVTSSWLPLAHSVLGPRAAGWGNVDGGGRPDGLVHRAHSLCPFRSSSRRCNLVPRCKCHIGPHSWGSARTARWTCPAASCTFR